jgi:hypothetical protein
MKKCSKCNETKPYERFQRRDTAGGYRGVCKECRAAENRRRYKPGQRRDLHLKATYGISLEQYEEMAEQQYNLCANPACTEPPIVVDHNHITGEVRGLLCNGCNTAAGLAGDSADKLRGLATYLDERGSYALSKWEKDILND